MKLFILGQSQSGKTTLAKRLAQTHGLQQISASGWVKQIWQRSIGDFSSREDYIKAITQYSLECLQKNPNACVEYIRDQLDTNTPAVIDGIRNPHDFVNLFDWQCDRCIHLIYKHNPIPSNSFEQGLMVIQAYLNWLLENHFIQHQQTLRLTFQAFSNAEHSNSLESKIQWLSKQLDAALKHTSRENL